MTSGCHSFKCSINSSPVAAAPTISIDSSSFNKRMIAFLTKDESSTIASLIFLT